MRNATRTARAARREQRRAERAERYWVWTRWSDGRWGRGDGKADLLTEALRIRIELAALPAGGTPMALTPHLGAIDHHYRGGVAAVRDRVEHEIADALQELTAVGSRFLVAEARISTAEAALAAFGEQPPAERLARRNSVERHLPLQQIQLRNRREWDAERAPLVAEVDAARAALAALQDRWTQLDGAVRSRRALAGRRAHTLQEHAMRRHRHYERRLVRRHTDGARLVPLLRVTRPLLPAWVEEYCTEGTVAPWLDPAPSAAVPVADVHPVRPGKA